MEIPEAAGLITVEKPQDFVVPLDLFFQGLKCLPTTVASPTNQE
jgi:hypothetical protein